MIYARSDIAAVTISEAHGGCGVTHSRPVEHGAPAKLWALNCPPCEDHLRHDPHWSPTSAEIPETYDEAKAREDFDKRGAKDKDAVLTLALARLAGISSSELPESLTRMISGQPMHVPVQGQLECPSGHLQPAGAKFCAECGAQMSSPVAKASLPAAEPPVAPPADATAPERPKRIRDASLATLQALARSRGIEDSGTRSDLINRLGVANVTNNDLAALLVAV
jgi:hypothetical protein